MTEVSKLQRPTTKQNSQAAKESIRPGNDTKGCRWQRVQYTLVNIQALGSSIWSFELRLQNLH